MIVNKIQLRFAQEWVPTKFTTTNYPRKIYVVELENERVCYTDKQNGMSWTTTSDFISWINKTEAKLKSPVG